MLQAIEEFIIAEAIKHFADHNTPLTRFQVEDLVAQYMGIVGKDIPNATCVKYTSLKGFWDFCREPSYVKYTSHMTA